MSGSRRRPHLLAVALAAVVMTGCAGAPPATPTTTPGPPSLPIALWVLPPEEPVEARVAIPGERICFLVNLIDEPADGEPVSISATAVGARVLEVQPTELRAGVVGEVWVVPNETASEATARVEIAARRGDVSQVQRRTIAILPMADERAADAQPHFERWVAWLAVSQPQLGIDPSTAWQPTFVSTFLVVSHYAYWSDEWEMVVSWHNMIPPDDWSDIYLRRRGTELRPSLAFRQDSIAGATEPYPVSPPAEVLR